MKTKVKILIRWGAAGAFGLMLTLNVMVGLDFKNNQSLPTVTLVELGSQANAQHESGGSGDGDMVWGFQLMWEPCPSYWKVDRRICRRSSGGYCQGSAQVPCPGAPYYS